MSTKCSWFDKAWLAKALGDARAETLKVYAQLAQDEWNFPLKDNLNLPLWELGHVAYFQELWCLRRAGMGSVLPKADLFYDSAKVAHKSRWQLDLPAVNATYHYLEEVLQATLAALSNANTKAGDLYFYQLVLLHEHMHREAMRMSLVDLGVSERPLGEFVNGPIEFVNVAEGRYEVGAKPQDLAHHFIWDNEKWAHEVTLPAYSIADRLVTEAEFREFEIATQVLAPRAVLHPEHAVMGVSHDEATRYAAWCSARLPTEHEWQVAAHMNLLKQVHNTAWQWTSSVFAPFNGFAPDPYLEYSAPWFDGQHKVLKGGSAVSSPLITTLTYRNFYTSRRRDVFAGIRLAR